MPVPSTIQILIDDVDVTDKVIFSSAHFEAQASGGVGTFAFTLRDKEQALSPTTGDEVVLILDGKRYFGGYLMQVGDRFAFPVVDTSDVPAVTTRQFSVRGVNYNVLFDRLVVRDTSDYTHFLTEPFPASTQAGFLVKDLVNNYLDVPPELTVTRVDDVAPVIPESAGGGTFAWVNAGEQGVSWRREMEEVSLYNGAIYYIDANMRLHYHAPETVFSRWGFSDRPNNLTVPSSATTFMGATYGFREMNITEDLSNIVNDVFVWGGSPFIASDDPGESGVVFARSTNQDSIDDYGRWQHAEVRFGELGTQNRVDARARAIVPPAGSDRPPGLGADGVVRNRSKPEFSVSLVWFAHDVPTMSGNGNKDHLTPGDVVTFVFYVHGQGLTRPLILTLPLRRVSISFPTLPPDPGGTPQTYARFEGDFGLSLSDPFNLWEAILNRRRTIRRIVNSTSSPTQIGSSGGLWSGAPDESPNGTRRLFTLSSNGSPITYVAGSSEVFINGLLLRRGSDYSESPNEGTIYVFVSPPTGSSILVQARLA